SARNTQTHKKVLENWVGEIRKLANVRGEKYKLTEFIKSSVCTLESKSKGRKFNGNQHEKCKILTTLEEYNRKEGHPLQKKINSFLFLRHAFEKEMSIGHKLLLYIDVIVPGFVNALFMLMLRLRIFTKSSYFQKHGHIVSDKLGCVVWRKNWLKYEFCSQAKEQKEKESEKPSGSNEKDKRLENMTETENKETQSGEKKFEYKPSLEEKAKRNKQYHSMFSSTVKDEEIPLTITPKQKLREWTRMYHMNLSASWIKRELGIPIFALMKKYGQVKYYQRLYASRILRREGLGKQWKPHVVSYPTEVHMDQEMLYKYNEESAKDPFSARNKLKDKRDIDEQDLFHFFYERSPLGYFLRQG
ncbi:hypothetical protein RFI_13776, partial [Reticulomyxa filosa]